MPTFFINSDSFKASNAFVATLGAAPGSTYLGQILAAGLPAAANAMLSAMSATTATARGDAIAANLGLTGTAATTASNYLATVSFAGAASTHGAGLLAALDLFTTLQNDATFGAAATAYVARVNTALSYSSVAANNSTDLNTLAAVVGAAGTTGAGSTFTLTTNADIPNASTGNDTFSGTDTTLTAIDTIDGKGGTDTLVFAGAASYGGGATITSIENISVTSTAGGAFNMAGITGVQSLTNNAGTVATTAFNSAGSIAALTVRNSGNVATTVQYTEAAVAGTADSQSITVSGAGTATGARHTINVNSVTANTAGVETVAVTASGTESFIVLASNDTSLTSVTASGSVALDVDMGAALATATTINASGMTAAFTVGNLAAAAHTITGGSGNDVIAMAATLGTTDTVNGGDGTDTLSANAAELAAMTTTARATVSNIETLMIANDVGNTATAISASNFGSAVTNVRVADQSDNGAANITFNNIVAAASGSSNNFRFDGDLGANGGTITMNITGATNGGTANAVTLDMRGGATTATSTLAFGGVETLTISTANATGAKTFNITDAALQSLTVAGVQNVVLNGAALGTAVGTVDATGLTNSAALRVALSTSSISSATINTGAGADVIAATQLADTINSGSGNDNVQGNAGADVINVGTGTDTITQAAASDSGTFTAPATNTISTTTFDKVTGMAATDVLVLIAGGYSAAPSAGAADNRMVSTSTAGNTLVGAGANNRVDLIRGTFDSAANTFVGSASGTDTLVVYDSNAAQATTALEAIVLVGFTGTTTTIAVDGSVTLGA